MARLCKKAPVPIFSTGIVLAAALLCLSAGCDMAGSQPTGPGYPTVSAKSYRVEGSPPDVRLVLGGARDVLPSDTSREVDLSKYRNKTVVVVYSKRRAIALASVADIQLSVGGSPDGTPFELTPGEYELVSVSLEGEISYLDTPPIATILMTK